jgi:hypothetical protein
MVADNLKIKINKNMARPKKWKVGEFKKFKLKLYEEVANRYKIILDAKGKTIQQDFEDHVREVIK